LKICFLASFLKGFHGGGTISLKLLAEALEKEHKIYFITVKGGKDSDTKIISLPNTKYISERQIRYGNAFLDNFLALGLKKLLCNNPPDILHTQDQFIVPASIRVSKKLGIPVVATVRDNAWLYPQLAEELRPGFSWWMSRRIATIVEDYKKVDAIITVSDYIKKELVEKGVAIDKITTIYNLPPPWEPIKKTESSDKVTLLSLGRIAKYKGFEVLVKAVSLAKQKNKNFRVIVAGSGPYFKELKRLTKQLNLEEYISLFSAVPYEKVRELYFNSDVVLLLSTYPEPFGRVLLEAMTAGKPLIATNTGGIPEAVKHGVNGFLVPPNDPKRTAEALIELIEKEELRKHMGIAGRKILEEKFNPKKSIHKTIELYKKVISNDLLKSDCK